MRWLSKGRTYCIQTKKTPQELVRKLKSETASSFSAAKEYGQLFSGNVEAESFVLNLIAFRTTSYELVHVAGAPKLLGEIHKNKTGAMVLIKEKPPKSSLILFFMWLILSLIPLIMTFESAAEFLELSTLVILIPYFMLLLPEIYISNKCEKVLRELLGDSK